MLQTKYLLTFCLLIFSLSVVAEQQPAEEPLFGVKIMASKIAIRVKSNGCTSADNFNLVWQSQSLSIVRKQPDKCRRMPQLIWLTMAIKDDNLPFQLQNSVVGYQL